MGPILRFKSTSSPHFRHCQLFCYMLFWFLPFYLKKYVLSFGSIFGKRDLLAIFYVMKYDVKCGTCLHKFDCRETTLSNAANHFKIFLIEFEICLCKHLYFLYIRNPLFPIVVFISMLWQLKVNMFYPKNSYLHLNVSLFNWLPWQQISCKNQATI